MLLLVGVLLALPSLARDRRLGGSQCYPHMRNVFRRVAQRAITMLCHAQAQSRLVLIRNTWGNGPQILHQRIREIREIREIRTSQATSLQMLSL
jgi:hypothetical protein